MSARDVIASVAENKQFQIGAQKADAILSALDAAGYAVVPKEPTAEMVEAALTAKRGLQVNHHPTDQRVYLAKQISAALRAAAGSAREAKP